MRINNINIFSPNFKGKRQDRNAVSQLKNDNPYDLNVPNQRRISEAIDKLSNVSGEDNVNFLVDVADNLKYGTNIDLNKKSYNDWNLKLKNAAEKSLSLSDKSVQEKLGARVADGFKSQKPLTKTEKEILAERKNLLSQIDFNSLKEIPNENIRNIKNNLDYFIVSSEVPTSQKLYILKRFNYFMSPDYKINPQLADKKSQALAEMVNDIVINTPESKIPNVKAINQKHHGMCAAISICRKMLAYEDKANYVDMIMSELDDNNYMQVYDINHLGEHKKVPIAKCAIDYDAALAKGYRIVDTSAMNWMNIADTVGSANEFVGAYSAFDRRNFDAWTDAHITSDLEGDLLPKQDYYRALLKAKDKIGKYKKDVIESKYKQEMNSAEAGKNLKIIEKYNDSLRHILKTISPNSDSVKIREVANALLSLEVKDSDKAAEITDNRKDFVYLSSESEEAKINKIKEFLSVVLPEDKNSKVLDKQAESIFDLSDNIHSISSAGRKSYSLDREIRKANSLYQAAASYRGQYDLQFDVPDKVFEVINELKIPDYETRLIDNLGTLAQKVKNGTINPKIKETLAQRFGVEDDETLSAALEENKKLVEEITTNMLDDFYYATLSVDRKHFLATDLNAIVQAIDMTNNKDLMTQMADRMGVKPNKTLVVDMLKQYVNVLKSDNCSEEQYHEIYEKTGHISQFRDFKSNAAQLYDMMFEEQNPKIIQGFNMLHGLPVDAPLEQTAQVYDNIIKEYNNVAQLVTNFQSALKVVDEDGTILNSISAKDVIMKKLENWGEIPTEKELRMFQNKFDAIEKERARLEIGGRVKAKDLPSELTSFTPYEKRLLKNYESNINNWYASVNRKFKNQYNEIKEPLEELNRQIGVKVGTSWNAGEGHSGLNGRQQIKIIQHMTDRPYYLEHDGRLALAKIKESPYSGISSTSVLEDEPAGHAQYVVDVKPVNVNQNGKTVTKDVMVHDNTWGAIEHENTWVDDNGMLRTDYSNGYGGKLGYITDENYRNGKIADNILEVSGKFVPKNIPSKAYKKLNKSDADEFDFPLFYDMVLPGKYPNARSTVTTLRQNLTISPIHWIEDIEKYANGMTTAELKAAMKKVDSSSHSTDIIYDKILERINGDKYLSKGITSLDQYKEISKNDPLKVTLEKAAILRSYSDIPDTKQFLKADNFSDILKMKDNVRKEARKNFNYTFAKDIDVAKYGAESSRSQIVDLLEKVEKDNNVKISGLLKLQLVNAMKKPNSKNFDGSLEHTIDLMADAFEASFNSKVKKFPNKQEVSKEVAKDIKTILKENMKFTLEDFKGVSFSSGNLKSIENWIDRVFDPTTDEEFVQIFNDLRNMTTEEFDRLYNSKISDNDLGIKNISGYDVLKEVRARNEKTLNSLYNIIYNNEYAEGVQLSKTTPSYDYDKFKRVCHGANYVNGVRTFDDIYSEFYWSLKTLNIGKLYNRYKQDGFDKYQAFPSYPKIDYVYSFDEKLDTFFDGIFDDMSSINVFKVMSQSADLIKDMQRKLAKYEPNHVLTTRQKAKIIDDMQKFQELNKEDVSITDLLNAIEDTIQNGSTVKEFNDTSDLMWATIAPYLTTTSGMSIDEAIKSVHKVINTKRTALISSLVEPKYQKKATELFNKWVSSIVRFNANRDNKVNTEAHVEGLRTQFCDYVIKHQISESPEGLLNKFLLLNAKDAKPEGGDLKGEAAVTAMREFEMQKENYRYNLKAMLSITNLQDIQYALMKSAKNGSLNVVKDEFSKSKLDLTDGRSVSFDSELGMDKIIGVLTSISDFGTAKMFLEQLGLSDKFIEIASRTTDFDAMRKGIKRVTSILQSTSKQIVWTRQEVDKLLENIDDAPNYEELIKQAENNIIRKGKNTNYRASLKVIQKDFDTAIEFMKQNPTKPKSEILEYYMQQLNSDITESIASEVNGLQEYAHTVQKVEKLMEMIELPENSPMEELRKKYIAELDKVADYKDKMMSTKNNSMIFAE